VCGTSFRVNGAEGRAKRYNAYCSKLCSSSLYKKPLISCPCCGDLFKQKGTKTRYCSPACSYASRIPGLRVSLASLIKEVPEFEDLARTLIEARMLVKERM